MQRTTAVALVTALLLAAGPAAAQQQGAADGDRPIYGRQMVMQEKMSTGRRRPRDAGSEEERARIRAEHQEEMRQGAQERGVGMPRQGEGTGMGCKRGSAPVWAAAASGTDLPAMRGIVWVNVGQVRL